MGVSAPGKQKVHLLLVTPKQGSGLPPPRPQELPRVPFSGFQECSHRSPEGLQQGADPGRGREPLEGGGLGARGACRPLRPGPLPPRGSCPDLGGRRRSLFLEGSVSVSAARRERRKAEARAEKDPPGPGPAAIPRPTPGSPAPLRRSPPPGLRAAGTQLRSLARKGGEGFGAGRWTLLSDGKLLEFPTELALRGASSGREGRTVGRPTGRGVACGVPLASGGPARPPSEHRQAKHTAPLAQEGWGPRSPGCFKTSEFLQAQAPVSRSSKQPWEASAGPAAPGSASQAACAAGEGPPWEGPGVGPAAALSGTPGIGQACQRHFSPNPRAP
ncbi:translation initiation factor IF-2-like [Artibeus jamaicensis]|uniref:translation initiation factor IF-2-like n=1 Tax=Artibeus jamaicensis TaxID=9417 RepID=UPI00235B147C|nr:translation initiation factor IF-2-like [Artibeus jamaicensis]